MVRKKKNQKQGVRASFTETLGIDKIFHNERLNFFIGLLLFALAVYMILSFVSFFTTGAADQSLIEDPRSGEILNGSRQFANSCGSIGAHLAYFFMKQCFGLPAFLIPAFMLLLALHLIRAYRIKLLKWFLCIMVLMVWASVTLAKFLTPFFLDSHFNPGGDHGLYICQHIENMLGAPGLTAILALTAIAFLTYISAETIFVVRKILNPSKFIDRVKLTITNNEQPEGVEPEGTYTLETDDESLAFDNPETQIVEFEHEAIEANGTNETNKSNGNNGAKKQQSPADHELEIEAATEEEKADGKDLVPVGDQMLEPYDPKRDLENYKYPTLDLLATYEDDGRPYIDMSEQTANKNRIVEVLRNFGVEISMIKATVGPTITLYEITPAPGVKISKIRNLEDDIALSLSALGIRIIAPIPGKGTIGIEVPNAKKNMVSMQSVLNSQKFQETTRDLPCAMGKTITNEVFMFDLAKAPHLLVAGATGQGKSVGLNAILTSLLYKKHPAELKIVLVDPKMVEFSIYAKIDKHFLAKVPDDDASPIITDTSKVIRTLQSLCVEMDAR